ncbi:MAG TPA: pantetheine-phosphate adenylyltransferase [Deltaproteobacteria bacterium]|nr:pantetheine-phosphate adenylyltransferase [Deltaproteobacteria bacterium]
MTKHIAVYPGTFDPVTKGHLDIIARCRKLFDRLIVAVAETTSKTTLFDVNERVAMIADEIKDYDDVEVESFDTLLVEYVRRREAGVIVRGLRVVSDFEYEFQMALINRKLAADIETVFMMTADEYTAVSSRFIKQIAGLGGDLDPFVTAAVAAKLKEKRLT